MTLFKDNPFFTTNHKALPALTKQCFYLQIWVSLERWDGLMVLPVFVQSAFRRYFKQIDLDCSSVYQIYTSVPPPPPSPKLPLLTENLQSFARRLLVNSLHCAVCTSTVEVWWICYFCKQHSISESVQKHEFHLEMNNTPAFFLLKKLFNPTLHKKNLVGYSRNEPLLTQATKKNWKKSPVGWSWWTRTFWTRPTSEQVGKVGENRHNDDGW